MYHGIVELEAIPIPKSNKYPLAALIFPKDFCPLDKMYVIVGYEADRVEKTC